MEELFEKRVENFKKLNLISDDIKKASKIITSALKKGGKVIFCGNGGSAADSNHLAAEFISKFKKERKSLPAISLSSNNSIITAIGNDYGFDLVFQRQLEGIANKNDILYELPQAEKVKI